MFDEPLGSPFPYERLQTLHDEIEEKLKKIGVYVRNTGYQQPVDDDGSPLGDPFLLFECQIGNFAWSERVQDPEQDKFNDEFRGIAGDTAEEEFERIRREEKERRAGGSEGLVPPEEDAEGTGEGG